MAVGRERHFDVAEAFAPSELGERHDTKLLGAIHASNAGIPAIAIDYSAEAPPRNEIHDLREERLADIHADQFNRNARLRRGPMGIRSV
jgi:hypothetical protein